MPNPNVVAIKSGVVGSGGASSIVFSNIPQTYTDLILVLSVRTTRGGTWEGGIGIGINGNTSTGYTWRTIESQGSSTSTKNTSYEPDWTSRITASDSTAGSFANVEVYIPNYTSSAAKYWYADGVAPTNSDSTGAVTLLVGAQSSTAPITSLTIHDESNTLLVEFSSATLYGVTPAAVGAKATGGAIYSDSTYWYHVFGSSDTFVPTQNLTADVLIVAGGGGGGNGNGGGGGGAGGVLGLTAQSLTTTTYAVTIGGGGAVSADGTNSSFASSTALKGGRGGDAGNNGAGGSGTYGSGGGCGRDGGTLGGAGTSGQGFAGGNSAYPTGVANGGSGGGGAGGAGNNVISTDNENRLSPNGDGGVGTNAYASWLSAVGAGVDGYLAGGGGGSAYQEIRNPVGGLGGGGRGTMSQFGALGATAGVVSTGSGGGGGGTGAFKSAGQPGGSGLVIIRYAK